jgi:hypothetical protein
MGAARLTLRPLYSGGMSLRYPLTTRRVNSSAGLVAAEESSLAYGSQFTETKNQDEKRTQHSCDREGGRKKCLVHQTVKNQSMLLILTQLDNSDENYGWYKKITKTILLTHRSVFTYSFPILRSLDPDSITTNLHYFPPPFLPVSGWLMAILLLQMFSLTVGT